ncbi:hypothetical protein FAES_2299 [Fibrella aestuarina BUZ 2]|uniref:Uncharacterized protein n=1 Tax=Fibrella aestuarina BUZ 2 TaxID=1166018 RepID=I0K855_9BACT|nr:hypothetical protein [Fibrella aestuarina]CCH00308.1 hypothetical protein FAES_2299 [Fibrella aestuarina BUZ 2]
MLPVPSPQLPDKSSDQKKAEKLDKFRDHLLHQTHLTPKEELMLEKYRKAFAWRCKLFSPQQCVSMLMQEYSIKYSQAYQIMSESTKLYGKVEDIDKAGTTKILIETLYVAMSLAVKDKNAEAIIAATREIAKLTKLHVDEIPMSIDELMPARVAKYVQNNVTVNNYGPESPTNE